MNYQKTERGKVCSCVCVCVCVCVFRVKYSGCALPPHIANIFWPSSGPDNHFSLGPSTAKNDGPEVAQNWIKDKGHMWAITESQPVITLNWP